MEKVMTKEELLQLSDVTIDKMKWNGYKKLFSMLAVLGAMAGSVGIANALGVSQDVLENMVTTIMIANGVVAPYGIIQIFYNSFAIKTFKNKGVDLLKSGKMSEEEFYNNWLKEVWMYAHTNYNEVKRIVDQKMAGKETKIEDSEGDFTL